MDASAFARVALVSCVKQKRNSESQARDLYTSPLFRMSREYAERNADAWYILSAEYGVLHPDTIIKPYERTLTAMRKPERLEWAERVRNRLLVILPPESQVIILAGVAYRQGVESFLRDRGFHVELPLGRLAIGKRLQRLKELLSD